MPEFSLLPVHSFYVMCAVIGVLVVSTIIRLVRKARNPDKDDTELRLRINSWWWMIAILFAAISYGTGTGIVLFAVVSFLALKEFLSIVPTRFADRRVIAWAYLSIPVQYYWASIGWYGMFIIFIPVYTFLFLPLRMLLTGETRGFIHSAGVIHWAVMLTVFNLSHIAYLLALPDKNPLAGAIGPLLFLFLMTQANDVSQYVWGKSFGKHKIIPKISPNKTWEGFLGGLVTVTLISSLLAPYLTSLNWQRGLLAGLIIALAGFVGDVVISSVKRDLQIKDSGHLIPGHGGILDRLDSMTYTAPLFFHYFYYMEF